MPFANSLTRTLPGLPQEEIFWRLHFTLALMHYTITDLRRLEAISGGICDLGDTDALIARMVGFAVAGFEAPALAAAVPRILSGWRANENGRPKPPIPSIIPGASDNRNSDRPEAFRRAFAAARIAHDLEGNLLAFLEAAEAGRAQPPKYERKRPGVPSSGWMKP